MTRRRDFDSYLAVELWNAAVYYAREAGKAHAAGSPQYGALYAQAQAADEAATLALELHDAREGRERTHLGPILSGWGC